MSTIRCGVVAMLNALRRFFRHPYLPKHPRAAVRHAKVHTGEHEHLGEWVSPRTAALLDTQPTPPPDTLTRPAPDTASPRIRG